MSDYGSPEPERDENLRVKIHSTLSDIREALHKNGHLSSRQEALDEVSKLLFAHVVSVIHSGNGINESISKSNQSTARILRSFVQEQFDKYLPKSLAHEINSADFELKLKASENSLATEILSIFSRLDSSTVLHAVGVTSGVDVLNEVFGQFLSDSFIEEKEFGQYLTPNEVVRFMTRLGLSTLPHPIMESLTHPTKCKKVGFILDPSCGVGSFLTEAIRILHPQVISKHGAKKATIWLQSMVEHVVVGVDKSERMIRLSLTNLSLFGADSARLYFCNALARRGQDSVITNDFNNKTQLILTNPPFGAEYSTSELTNYEIATEWCSRKPGSVDSELLFLERYIDWLKPGGALVTIVPDSVLTNRGLFSDLRSGLSPHVELRSVISLPSVTFGAAGTTTKTSILHLVKRANGPVNKPVYFSICKDIGYSITTRSSHRRKISTGHNQLVDLLPEALGEKELEIGRLVKVASTADRWDATFHVGLSPDIARRLKSSNNTDVFLKDVAILSSQRVNPARSDAANTFRYIEISDVNSQSLDVAYKEIPCESAPSRARKLVRANDVLVSTVRPERKTVGVVPSSLDGAVCSTGFAVIKCTGIDPILLAFLIQSDFVNEQILRNNIGIAYPAISEDCLPHILLPITKQNISRIAETGIALRELKDQLSDLECEIKKKISKAILTWTDTVS